MEKEHLLIGAKIFRLARAITNRNNAYLKALDITGVQAESLMYITDHQGKTINDLKSHLGVTHQAAQGLVKRMVDKDFIRIERFEKDGRQKILIPTPKGIGIRRQLRGNAVNAGEELLAGVSEEEKEIFYNVLTKALDIMERKGKEPIQ